MHGGCLGMAEHWENGVIHRYTYVKCKATQRIGYDAQVDEKPLIPMSLDLKGQLTWAWAMHANGCVQFAVEQPEEREHSQSEDVDLLSHWLKVLESHRVIKSAARSMLAKRARSTCPSPVRSAGVANRTLLIGPAGEFFTACAEDIIPRAGRHVRSGCG